MQPTIPEEVKPTVMKTNIPIITFLTRTWWLLGLMIATNYAVLSNHAWRWVQLPTGPDGTPGEWIGVTLFDMTGAVLYIPAIASVTFWVYLLVLHLFFRDTIDKDTHDGTYIADWRALSSTDRMYINAIIRVGFFIGFCILAAGIAKGAPIPDQVYRWNNAKINPKFSIALDCNVAIYKRLAERYQKITAMRQNGVPAPVIFCLHQRESSGSFLHHPHEGSPLTGRTRYVPKGRLPYPPPPYKFEQSAEDAYYVVDRLDRIKWNDVQDSFQGIESFNGLGYQKYHPETPSPYICNGVLINGRATKGKYTADGRFDRNATDKQLGVMAILLRMKQQGIVLPW